MTFLIFRKYPKVCVVTTPFDVLFHNVFVGKFELQPTSFDLNETLRLSKDVFELVAAQKQLSLHFRTDPLLTAILSKRHTQAFQNLFKEANGEGLVTNGIVARQDLETWIQFIEAGTEGDAACDDDRLKFYGDEVRLRQILNNLVSNAVKFTPSGGKIEVTVELVKICCSNSSTLCTDTVTERHSNTPFHYGLHRSGDDATSASSSITSGRCSPTYEHHSLQSNILPSNMTMKFTVVDDGIGISNENLKLLFQPFKQLDSCFLQKGNGSGLGLAVVQQIVELSGGTFGVNSQVGTGSSFWFEITWPLAPLSSLCGQEALSRQLRRQSRRYNLQANATLTNGTHHQWGQSTAIKTLNGIRQLGEHSLHILVVDDCSLTSRMMCRVLQQLGHCCDVAENGQEALQKLFDKSIEVSRASLGVGCRFDVRSFDIFEGNRQTLEMREIWPIPHAAVPYDVVFMDNQMPVLCGEDAVREIRRRGCRIPVVGITGNALKVRSKHICCTDYER
jgi:signal transduction histidine kinase